MATVSQSGLFTLQAFTSTGAMMAGGRLYFYVAGTTTKKDVYTDAAGSVPHTLTSDGVGGEYLALDARGEAPAPLYLTSGAYDVTLKTAAGATVWTRQADPVGADIAASGGAALVGFLQAGSGAVATTAQAKMRETFSAFDFMTAAQVADVISGAGAVDVTAALETACAALPDNSTLIFPPGTYLISHIWTALSDSDSTDGIGRGRAVCYFSERSGIRLYGPNATIKCVNHNIGSKGGFVFAKFRKSPNCTVEGFNFDMTFTGYNESGSYYPICGGVIATDKFNGGGAQTALCSNFTARDLTFKLYHPNGAFAITADPYGSDYNNGYKVVALFASGDSAATDYDEQSRGLLVENIRFKAGHNGYGAWGVAYNNATFRDIHAEAWVASSYTIASTTSTGTYYVAPVRYYQYYCEGLTVDNVTVLSLPWADRSGAFVGRCGGVSIESGLTTVATGGGVVSNCTFVLDNDDATLGGVFDVGIASSLSGNVRISNNSFSAHTNAAAVGIYAINAGGTGESNYSITNNVSSKKLNGPFVQVVNGNDASDATRIIKSMAVCGNIVKGWGADGAVYTYRTGTTYYGVEHVVVTDNIFDGTGSTSASTGTAVDVRGRTSADNLIVTNNVVKGAGTPVQEGSATAIITDNVYGSNTGNGSAINYLTNTSVTLASFAATEAVTWTVATGDYHEYYYIEYTATNTIAMILAGVADSATGTIRTVASGNTGKLTYKKVGNIK